MRVRAHVPAKNKNRRKSLSWVRTLLIALGLVALNVAIVSPLFMGEYTQYMGSIEAAFIADARFIAQNFPHLSWNPLWYLGFPFRFFYPPIFHYSVGLVHKLVPMSSVARIYRLLTATLYVLGPSTLYLFVRYLLKKPLAGFIAAIIYSLAPSVAYVLTEVRDLASAFNFAPDRLIVLIRFGEGPHVSTLTVLPLTLIAFLYALRKPSYKSYVAASVLIAVVPLLNWPSTISLAITTFALVLSEGFVGRSVEKIKRPILIILTAYGLAAFWLTISYVKVTFGFASGEGSGLLRNYLQLFPAMIIVLPLAFVILSWLFQRVPEYQRQVLIMLTVWIGWFSLIVFSWYLFGRTYAPQPNRFVPEIDMGVATLLGLMGSHVYEKISAKGSRASRALGLLFVAVLFASLVSMSLPFLRSVRDITRPHPDITSTSEYRIARWLEANAKGQRVFATGSTAFWLDAFADVPQVRGGADQGATNPWWAHATYQIVSGEDAEISLMWLRALDVSYIVVNYPDSRDFYKDYRLPEKFEERFEEVYKQAGDVIYKVPLRQPLLAQVVNKATLLGLRRPESAVDKEALRKYVDYIESPFSPASLTYTSETPDEIVIKANLEEGEAVGVQITYDPGWKAVCNGQPVKIEQDALGFVYIDPQRAGDCEIILKHGKTWDIWLGYSFTVLTCVALVVWSAAHFRSFFSDGIARAVDRGDRAAVDEEQA